jgi:hypothetical protein
MYDSRVNRLLGDLEITVLVREECLIEEKLG